MSDEQTREDWVRFRQAASDAAEASKRSHEALFDLFDRYRELSPEEREVIGRLLADDLQSGDETLRFDALAVIDEFRIVSALSALRALAARLETATGPGAPYEWNQVNRIIGQLTSG